MGKSKSKKSQLKRYPTPTDKYLIVTDPWGGVPIQEPNFFNHVTAWFEIMLKPKYPGARPSAIFYQWTNKNIIVEIPDHIDVEPYLGAHYWSSFLVPPHCYNVGTRASYVYEFETKFFPIPATQGGWTPGYAQYTKIRPNFDVRDPYPLPLPAPNSPLPFAKKLPPGRVGQIQPLPLPPLEPLPKIDDYDDEGPSQQQGSSGESSKQGEVKEEKDDRARQIESVDGRVSDPRKRGTTPADKPHFRSYEQPGHLAEAKVQIDTPTSMPPPPPPLLVLPSPKTLKKMDPYEEEEAAMNLLRSPATATTDSIDRPPIIPFPSPTRGVSVKSEVEVKQELPHDDFLELDDDSRGYNPSRELLDAFNSLQHNPLQTTTTTTTTTTPAEDDDDDLPDFVDDETEEDQFRTKVEADVEEEDDGEGYQPSTEWAQAFSSIPGVGPGESGYNPSEDLLSALASLPQEMVDTTPSSLIPPLRDSGMKVKLEPEDDVSFAALGERGRSKRLGSDITPVRLAGGRVSVKREPSDEYESVKRVKLER